MNYKSQKNRICFFIGSMQLGGIGILSLNLIKYFVEQDIKVDLFLLKSGGEYIQEVPNEVNIYIAEGNTLNRIYKYISYLNKAKPAVSISARQRLDLINILCCLCSYSSTKPIISIHTNLTTELQKGQIKSNHFPVLSKLLYKYPKKIIAVSKGVADDFSKRTGVKRKQIKVIYNPVYLPYDENSPKATIPVFESLKQSRKRFIISSSRLAEQKDLFTLIKAFAIVKKEMDLSLVILGNGPQKEEIEHFIKELNLNESILMLGFVQNPLFFIKDASAFVLSSKWEGFGNVLVEAMGVGTPVVSTDCPSGPSEILVNGEYGKLVPVEDEKALAKAIIETIHDPLPQKVLQERAKFFSVPKIAEEYLQYLLRS